MVVGLLLIVCYVHFNGYMQMGIVFHGFVYVSTMINPPYLIKWLGAFMENLGMFMYAYFIFHFLLFLINGVMCAFSCERIPLREVQPIGLKSIWEILAFENPILGDICINLLSGVRFCYVGFHNGHGEILTISYIF